MTRIDDKADGNKPLAAYTTVVSKDDGEPGRLVRVCTTRRNGIDVWSYVVDTTYGREIWDAGDLFVPQS